jgi:hypothetical protein
MGRYVRKKSIPRRRSVPRFVTDDKGTTSHERHKLEAAGQQRLRFERSEREEAPRRSREAIAATA